MPSEPKQLPKTRPIIFSGPMVRAILEGRKTQTRRIVKPQPIHIGWFDHQNGWCAKLRETEPQYEMVKCPYGVPGDRLWVRETWRRAIDEHDREFIVYESDGEVRRIGFDNNTGKEFLLDGEWEEPIDEERRKRPSRHMPRWASRLTLIVKSVRVERVQDIAEEDARAEGVSLELCDAPCPKGVRHQVAFACLWDSIHGPGAWERNDWVWALDFEREAVKA